MSRDFPIYDVLSEVKEKLNSSQTLLLEAPPGAGKSTILPIELLNEKWLAGKKIILLEPRRIAARMVAQRMADLLNENVGETIGYRIRFETKISSKTKIEVVTEGILTRMLQNDNALENAALVIFDEFHERSIHADLSLALCRQLQQVLRDDLKILVMSATLDGERISNALNNCPVIKSEGRQFPVQIIYSPDESMDYFQKKTARLILKAYREQQGDILVFLPGAGEISSTREILEQQIPANEVFTLFGDLPFHKQQEAILPNENGKRKIILATSIAETSLTIEGVTTVVDCGLARVPKFDPNSGLTKLETVKVTKDAADQRAGRAGRLGPGVCYRMWSEGNQLHLLNERKPEITEADLSSLMLELFNWGVKSVEELNWITSPPKGNVAQAVELLEELEAVKNNRITGKGKEMLSLPTHPRLAHMILEAKNNLALAADVLSTLEERSPFRNEQDIDLISRIESLRKFRKKENVNADKNVLQRIEKLSSQWRNILKCNEDNAPASVYETGKLIAEAYPDRIAKQITKNKPQYKLSNGKTARIPEQDSMISEEWIAVANIDAGSNEGKIFLAAALDVNDVMHLAREKNRIEWSEEKEMILSQKEKYIGAITISTTSYSQITEEERIKAICETIKKNGLRFIGWGEKEENFQNRIASLKNWHGESEWPDLSEKILLDTLELWLGPYLLDIRKKNELQQLNKTEILESYIGWDKKQLLDKLAPEKIKIPSDSQIKVNYFSEGKNPEVHVRLQEVFGMMDTPTVNNGKIKITLHLLSPGYKPVQVTQDLKSFWTNAYHEVRKELQRRYPKHSWPEDPFTAQAVRGPIRRKN